MCGVFRGALGAARGHARSMNVCSLIELALMDYNCAVTSVLTTSGRSCRRMFPTMSGLRALFMGTFPVIGCIMKEALCK